MFQADAVEVTILVDNWVDMLLPNIEGVHDGCPHCCVLRTGLIEHFDSRLIPPQAENGISLYVRVTKGRYTSAFLFDVGLTGVVLEHNLRALHMDRAAVDQVIISHGHPDHYGGISQFLAGSERQVPVLTHPDAFLPRYAVMQDGRTAGFYNAAFNDDEIDRAGGRPVLNRDALDLGWGVYTTGQIPRLVDFEGPRPPGVFGTPGLYQVNSAGEFVMDEVWDEQALIIDVRDEGLVVLTGCAHAGVVNTVRRAREICGEASPIRAVMGGFHLGFPTTPMENVGKTVEAMREMDVMTVVPMHCSGLRAQQAFVSELPRSYVQPAVGTAFRFGK